MKTDTAPLPLIAGLAERDYLSWDLASASPETLDNVTYIISQASDQRSAQLVTIETQSHCDEVIAGFPAFVSANASDPTFAEAFAGIACYAGDCPLVAYLSEITGQRYWSISTTTIVDFDRQIRWRTSDLGRRIIEAIDDAPSEYGLAWADVHNRLVSVGILPPAQSQ